MKNTLENSKLIADFIGADLLKDLLSDNNGFININVDIYEQCKFHSDWNWLMEVVEKIHSMQSYGVFINPNGTYIQDEDDKIICMTFKNEEVNGEIISSSNIEATFNCCAEFIKWYNNHLCSNCGRFDDVVGTHNIDTCEECALNN